MLSIMLYACDGEIFPIDKEVAKVSGYLNAQLEEITDCEGKIIELPNINSATLRKVIEWMTYHKNDIPSYVVDDEQCELRTDNINIWDSEFLNLHHSVVLDIILAANYLKIGGLLDVAGKMVANMIKGRTTEEMREAFNIENDFSEVQEKSVNNESSWCEK